MDVGRIESNLRRSKQSGPRETSCALEGDERLQHREGSAPSQIEGVRGTAVPASTVSSRGPAPVVASRCSRVSIRGINEAARTFSACFTISLQWVESRGSEGWEPVLDASTRIGPCDVSDLGRESRGAGGVVMKRVRVQGTFAMQGGGGFSSFPFDKQVLCVPVRVTSGGRPVDAPALTLLDDPPQAPLVRGQGVERRCSLAADLSVRGWRLLGWDCAVEEGEELVLRVHMGRRWAPWVQGVLVPLTCLSLSSLIVFTIDAHSPALRAQVLLLLVLVIVSFRGSLRDRLPPSPGGMTRLDCFLLAHTLAPLLLLLHTAIVAQVQDPALARSCDRFMLVVMLLLTLLRDGVCLAYCIWTSRRGRGWQLDEAIKRPRSYGADISSVWQRL